MFLREIKDTLRQTGFIMAFYAMTPFLYLIDRNFYQTGTTFFEYIGVGYTLFWIITAVYLAYNMFRAEDSDDAREYLLSLPISRWKLFIFKMVPRVAILSVLAVFQGYISYFCCRDVTSWYSNSVHGMAFIVFVQICGFILGIVGRKSWIARSVLLVMVICVLLGLGIIDMIFERVIDVLWESQPFSVVVKWNNLFRNSSLFLNIAVNFALLALIIVPIYKSWDLKPMRVRELRFAKRSIIPLLILAAPVVYLVSS